MVKHRYDPNRFVLVSVDLVDGAWRAADEGVIDETRRFYVGTNGAGSDQPGKYEVAKQAVASGTWKPPVVGFVGDNKNKIAFMDGRYHFAAARDLGRRSITVEVESEQAATFREKFGV